MSNYPTSGPVQRETSADFDILFRTPPASAPEGASATAAPTGAVPSPATPPSVIRGTNAHQGRAALDFGTTTTTVTLWDRGVHIYSPISSDQRACMASEFAKLLQTTPAGPPETGDDWQTTVTDLAERLLADEPSRPTGSEALRQLTARLSGSDGRRSRHLDDVIAGLERVRASRGGQLGRFLTSQLHHCYETGLKAPPLDALRLFRVYLDGYHANELKSIVYDQGQSADPRFTLVRPEPAGSDGDTTQNAGEGDQREVPAYRGLKQQLGLESPRVGRNGEPQLDELIGGALGDLVRRTDTYLARFRREHSFAPGQWVNSVVVTFPTMVPLSVRDTLRSLLLDFGIGKVVTRFDEATAAAMFFVLRELGGSFETSIEAFAARSRPQPESKTGSGRPTGWCQNLLIVDVGGGTTDVALLRLELQDETDRTVAGADSPQYGRYFRLTPTVLGTTGDTQRGGDYLTLQVFRWIKVVLADHLLAHEPSRFVDVIRAFPGRFINDGHYQPGKLVELVGEGLTGLWSAADAAELVVSTAWRKERKSGTSAVREQLFLMLWELADSTKIELGKVPAAHTSNNSDSDEVALNEQSVRDVLRLVREMHSGSGNETGQNRDTISYRMSRRRFEDLVANEVDEVMQEAAALAVKVLDGEPLDRVILAGRGALLPLVRRKLVDAFAAQAARRTGRGLSWNPTVITPADEYAKHAASIGACWAETIAQSAQEQEEVREQLALGVTWLNIDVDNMFQTLSGTFEIPGQDPGGSAGSMELFSMGDELRSLVPGEPPVVRNAGWIKYKDSLQVQRRKMAPKKSDRRSSINWAFFRVEDHLQTKPLKDFEWSQELEEKLYVQVEVTASLDMTVLLRSGDHDPHYEVGASLPLRDVRQSLAAFGDSGPPAGGDSEPATSAGTAASDGEGRALHDVPCDVVVNPNVGGATADAMVTPIFPAGTPFTRTVVVDGAPASARLAAVSEQHLPPPKPDGWHFYRRRVGEGRVIKDTWIATVEAPKNDSGIRVYAVLDELGELRVHVGETPFRAAADLGEVFTVPGTVLRVPMTAHSPGYNSDDDPFTGEQ